jgi:glutamine synthetase adenylyltransferase
LQHNPLRGPYDIRRGKGGLVELEFACQSLQLAWGCQHDGLIGARSLPQLIADLHQAEILSAADYDGARHAAQYFATLRQIASLCLEDNEKNPAIGIENLLLEAVNEPDMGRLKASLAAHRGFVERLLSNSLAAIAATNQH